MAKLAIGIAAKAVKIAGLGDSQRVGVAACNAHNRAAPKRVDCTRDEYIIALPMAQAPKVAPAQQCRGPNQDGYNVALPIEQALNSNP